MDERRGWRQCHGQKRHEEAVNSYSFWKRNIWSTETLVSQQRMRYIVSILHAKTADSWTTDQQKHPILM
jgi:hypothetical protein